MPSTRSLTLSNTSVSGFFSQFQADSAAVPIASGDDLLNLRHVFQHFLDLDRDALTISWGEAPG